MSQKRLSFGLGSSCSVSLVRTQSEQKDTAVRIQLLEYESESASESASESESLLSDGGVRDQVPGNLAPLLFFVFIACNWARETTRPETTVG